jgi:glycosyltransferase involved in cell wall biosynthesis
MANDCRLRLLQVSQRFSAYPTSGAELRIHHLATHLARHMCVTHLGFSPGGVARSAVIPHERLEFIPVARSNGYGIFDLARGALGRVPFPVLNYTRENMKDALGEQLGKTAFDIVQLESVHLAGYLPLLRAARNRPRLVVCDWHNIESELMARYGDGTAAVWRKLYARRSAGQLASFEKWFADQCDLHVVVSERDRETLIRYGTRAPVLVIDNGVDVKHFSSSPDSPDRRFRVLFVGSMDYHANIDAVVSFARDAWPRIHSSLPEAVFTVVGRNPTAGVRALAAMGGIEITGTVGDTKPYYREAWAVVVPIRVAGGTRIKILEAMAAGVPVVSTGRGAEGLAAEPGLHYLLADTDHEIHAALTRLAGDPALGSRLAAAAMELVRHRYDWPVLGDRLAAALARLLEAPAR